jgi:hypothetical protein
MVRLAQVRVVKAVAARKRQICDSRMMRKNFVSGNNELTPGIWKRSVDDLKR